jgi:hypothetical protein
VRGLLRRLLQLCGAPMNLVVETGAARWHGRVPQGHELLGVGVLNTVNEQTKYFGKLYL